MLRNILRHWKIIYGLLLFVISHMYQDDNAPLYRTRVVSNYTMYVPKVRGLVALPR